MIVNHSKLRNNLKRNKTSRKPPTLNWNRTIKKRQRKRTHKAGNKDGRTRTIYPITNTREEPGTSKTYPIPLKEFNRAK